MKVLMIGWATDKGWVNSISKDKQQLEETTERLAQEGKGMPEPGGPIEVEVPDDHAFAEMVQRDTVFLCEDEMHVITYPEA